MRRVTLPALACAAACTMLAACGSSATARTAAKHTAPPVVISPLQACQRLLADMNRNGGTPDKPTLQYLADHVQDVQMSTDAGNAIPDVGNTVMMGF